MTNPIRPLPSRIYPRQRYNFVVIGIDYIAFALALGFMNSTTVLPAFASRLGASSTVIGIITTMYLFSWNIPQLIAGNIIARAVRKKPVLIMTAIAGRPMILLFAVYIFLTGAQPPWLALVLLATALILFMLSDSFAAVAWLDILSRAFPSEKRGGFISYWQIGKGLSLLGVAAIVRWVLSSPALAFPMNYAVLFGGASLMLFFSALAVTRIYEPPVPGSDDAEVNHIEWRDYGTYLFGTLREDVRLRRITIARLFLLFSLIANSFYVLFATQELQLPESVIAFYIAAQTIGALLASILLGYIADRFGPHRVIKMGVLFLLSAPMLALIISLTASSSSIWLRNAYIWVYICIGLTENLMMLGYMNYLLDISPDNQRTLYIGIYSTFSSLGQFAGVAGGWLLDHTSFSVLFSAAVLLGMISAIVALRLPPVHRQRASV